MDQKRIDSAKMVLDASLKEKGSQGEVFLLKSKNLHLEVENGELEVIKESEDMLMAVRILRGHSLGFAYCTDFTSSSLELLIEQVVASAKNTDQDLHYIFPYPQPGNILSSIDEKIASIDIKEKFRRCQEMEKAAYQTDSRIKAARHVSYADSVTEVYLINSHGLEVSYRNTSCSTFAMVVAQEGMDSQMSWEMDIQTSYDHLKWKEIAEQAAKKAVGLLGARSISTRKASIIIAPSAAVSLIGSFATAFFADSVQKGRSLMAGRLGKTVASPEVVLIDDGCLSGGLATAPYDGEGVPTQRTYIINKGELKAFLYDTYSAHKDGVSSTGNGIRPGPKSQPQVGSTNLFIENGTKGEDDLIASVKEALYVIEIMGAHTINPVSGDFSIGATGYWIENGAKAYPVRGVTISGNMLELLQNISACANNLKFYGHFGTPSLLVSEMIIAGEAKESGARSQEPE